MKTIDYDIAMAAGIDAANTRMRKAGRTRWNRQDYNLAAATFNKLLPVKVINPFALST